MERKRQTLGVVVFADADERRELQQFCRQQYGRSFSAQCRFMLLQARREIENEEQQAVA